MITGISPFYLSLISVIGISAFLLSLFTGIFRLCYNHMAYLLLSRSWSLANSPVVCLCHGISPFGMFLVAGMSPFRPFLINCITPFSLFLVWHLSFLQVPWSLKELNSWSLPNTCSGLSSLQRLKKDTIPKIQNKYSQKRNCVGSAPNFHIHVSVSDLYISRIGLPVLLQE